MIAAGPVTGLALELSHSKWRPVVCTLGVRRLEYRQSRLVAMTAQTGICTSAAVWNFLIALGRFFGHEMDR